MTRRGMVSRVLAASLHGDMVATERPRREGCRSPRERGARHARWQHLEVAASGGSARRHDRYPWAEAPPEQCRRLGRRGSRGGGTWWLRLGRSGAQLASTLGSSLAHTKRVGCAWRVPPVSLTDGLS
nr:hypothetical protein Itr_chr05CG17740 [Ipomoea trifida]